MSKEENEDVNALIMPDRAYTRDGAELYPNRKCWAIACLGERTCYNFERFLLFCSDRFVLSLKGLVLWYLRNSSTVYAHSVFAHLLYFIRFVSGYHSSPIELISSSDVINYKASLPRRREWRLKVLAAALKQWFSLGYPGVDAPVVDLLSDFRIRANLSGEAVRTLDPERGPFSDIEIETIHSSINEAYATGGISLDEYVLVWLFSALGARSIQYAALKIKDFIALREKDGRPLYLLRVPRAKQPGKLCRTGFKERKLIAQIGELVAKQVESVRATLGELVADPSDLPLFPSPLKNSVETPGFRFHSSGKELGIRLQKIFGKIQVTSERTGKTIAVHARRFRYTLGTRAAMEGAGELVIAELLDHSNTENVGVYVEARPEIIERIDKAMAMYLAPLAQAFQGIIIDCGSKEEPASQVIDPESDPSMHPVGSCGKYGFCGFAAPVACYTCRSFQPWLDGPHEAVLERLIKERDDILSRTGDLRIASVNDRTILAVAQLVHLCKGSGEVRS